MRSPLKKMLPPLAALASAALLRAALPPLSNSEVAFFAVVPLLLALRRAAPRQGFRLGGLFGLAYWLSSLSWLAALRNNGGPLPLVVFGLLALSAWMSLFNAVFGWLSASLWTFSRRDGLPAAPFFRAAAWLCEPLLWAGAEYLASTLFTGFPWNPVAATQTPNLALLSVTSLGGAQLLSALVITSNSAVASMLSGVWHDVVAPRFHATRPQPIPRPPSLKTGAGHFRCPRTLPLAFASILLLAAWWRGIDRVRALDHASLAAPQFRIALVHPDAACIFERDDDAVAAANKNLLSFTELASATSPDLVVWPETSLPGYIPYDREAAALIRDACQSSGAPLLAGGVEYAPRFPGDDNGLIFNSAILFDATPSIRASYRKRHLVPFGEYIPLESRIPALKRLAPTGFSCEPGIDATLLAIEKRHSEKPRAAATLAPLICFEDAFPYLARQSALSGADAIVSIANDAWFDGTSEPEQHLSQAILRAVETGLPVIRSTNRGVTAFVLPSGRILRRIGDGFGAGTPGFITAEIGITKNPARTTYARFGDALFACPCAGLLLGLAAALLLIRRK